MEKLYLLKNNFGYICEDISEDNISTDIVADAAMFRNLEEVHLFINAHYALLVPDIVLGLFAEEYEKVEDGKWVYTGKYILSAPKPPKPK